MLTPLDLKEKTFSKGFRGYDAEEVNQFLRQIAREYERLYKDNEDLINIGAYKSGANPTIDFAISKINQVNEFLMQGTYDKYSYEEISAQLEGIFSEGGASPSAGTEEAAQ